VAPPPSFPPSELGHQLDAFTRFSQLRLLIKLHQPRLRRNAIPQERFSTHRPVHPLVSTAILRQKELIREVQFVCFVTLLAQGGGVVDAGPVFDLEDPRHGLEG
jgi:hypothetical protein